MTSKCFSLVRGRVMRVTELDGCGQPIPGPRASIVSDGFITVGLTANIDEGTAISVTNAAGRVCISDQPCPSFTGYTIAVEFCGVDPDLFAIFTGQPLITEAQTGDSVGFKMNSAADACAHGFALELWSSVPQVQCSEGQTAQFGYFLIPFAQGGVIGDFTIGNDAVNFSLSGAASKDGSGWGVGPYDVVYDENGLPSPLTDPVDPNDHLLMQLTPVPPPDSECGAVAVGVPATGATAGTPGTWTPANSYGPEDLAELQASSITASPTTAWTAGQHVRLRDGSVASWDGTGWVEGPGTA